MRKYETLLLLNPELPAETGEGLISGFTGVVERENGRILAVDDWGMKDLAYPVRKQMRGHYVRLEYAAPGAAVAELERIIRIADGVFKFITVQLDENFTEAAEADAVTPVTEEA